MKKFIAISCFFSKTIVATNREEKSHIIVIDNYAVAGEIGFGWSRKWNFSFCIRVFILDNSECILNVRINTLYSIRIVIAKCLINWPTEKGIAIIGMGG